MIKLFLLFFEMHVRDMEIGEHIYCMYLLVLTQLIHTSNGAYVFCFLSSLTLLPPASMAVFLYS
jgi:hypothetical protein